jgi:hypothetical protein
MNVQGFFADDASSDENEGVYEGMTCLARGRVHLINRSTHKLLNDDDE